MDEETNNTGCLVVAGIEGLEPEGQIAFTVALNEELDIGVSFDFVIEGRRREDDADGGYSITVLLEGTRTLGAGKTSSIILLSLKDFEAESFDEVSFELTNAQGAAIDDAQGGVSKDLSELFPERFPDEDDAPIAKKKSLSFEEKAKRGVHAWFTSFTGWSITLFLILIIVFSDKDSSSDSDEGGELSEQQASASKRTDTKSLRLKDLVGIWGYPSCNGWTDSGVKSKMKITMDSIYTASAVKYNGELVRGDSYLEDDFERVNASNFEIDGRKFEWRAPNDKGGWLFTRYKMVSDDAFQAVYSEHKFTTGSEIVRNHYAIGERLKWRRCEA
mgnify:CR=1 FL=1